MTLEVPQRNWKQFCEKMTELHRGAMMDVRIQTGGDFRVVAQNVPLQAVTFDENSDVCNNAIVIEFGATDKRLSEHRVIDPARFILRKQSGGDRYTLLELPAENGTTVIIFHPGISPTILNELEIPMVA